MTDDMLEPTPPAPSGHGPVDDLRQGDEISRDFGRGARERSARYFTGQCVASAALKSSTRSAGELSMTATSARLTSRM